VQLQLDVEKQCFYRRLCRHSLSIWSSTLVQADLSLATSPLMLSTFFWQWASLWPLSSFPIIFVQSGVAKLGRGTYFYPGTCMINVWHVIYMMNSPFEGWHMVVTLVWWNKNLDSCPNSTMKIFLVTTIGSPTSFEFKMLQEGFALMQNNVYGAHILKAGSNLFKWDKR